MPPYGLNANLSRNSLQSSSIAQDEISYPSSYDQAVEQVTDWRVLDKFVASQLSHEDVPQDNHEYLNVNAAALSSVVSADDDNSSTLVRNLNSQEILDPENTSNSISSCQIDLWK